MRQQAEHINAEREREREFVLAFFKSSTHIIYTIHRYTYCMHTLIYINTMCIRLMRTCCVNNIMCV